MANDSRPNNGINKNDGGRLTRHNWRAMIGGVITAGIAAAGLMLTGSTTGFEARVLLEAMQPSLRFFCTAVSTASATMLALMLTLLGLSFSIETHLKPVHYKRVQQISLLDVLAFTLAIILLLLLTSPIVESQELPAQWYSNLYYGMVIASAALGGLIIGIMILLYGAVEDLIDVVLSEDASALAIAVEEGEDMSGIEGK